jgi:hypothetical protein
MRVLNCCWRELYLFGRECSEGIIRFGSNAWNYAFVMRKNHHNKERAAQLEARFRLLAAYNLERIRRDASVDVRTLLREKKR